MQSKIKQDKITGVHSRAGADRPWGLQSALGVPDNPGCGLLLGGIATRPGFRLHPNPRLLVKTFLGSRLAHVVLKHACIPLNNLLSQERFNSGSLHSLCSQLTFPVHVHLVDTEASTAYVLTCVGGITVRWSLGN